MICSSDVKKHINKAHDLRNGAMFCNWTRQRDCRVIWPSLTLYTLLLDMHRSAKAKD